MDKQLISSILENTAYVRVGGSEEEKTCSEYLKTLLDGISLEARSEDFEVQMATIHEASLIVDNVEIACKGYLNCGSGEVEAPLYYLTDNDRCSLSGCEGKIVLIDGYLGAWKYRDIYENGAVGFISYDGNVNYADRDIDQRELRAHYCEGKKILGVNINVKDAVKLIENDSKLAKIKIVQDETVGTSQNVVADIEGESDRMIVFTAHYDSTSLSQGAYDNMSGCIGLLGIAEHFKTKKPKHNLRFIFCGSEERGLLGSKAYCAQHEEELEKIDLVVNLDMIGTTMGKFIACATSETALVNYISYLGCELGFQVKAYQDVYSSDSTPFADKGIPAVSFCRAAGGNIAPIHNSYDTRAVLKAEQMLKDINFIVEFSSRMANATVCPVAREMPQNMKDKLDEYLLRKRK